MEPAVLAPLYAALCVREEPPSDEEAEELGMRTVVRVYRAREGLRKAEAGPGMEKDSEGVYRVVGEVFGVEVPAVSTGDDKTGGRGGFPDAAWANSVFVFRFVGRLEEEEREEIGGFGVEG